jgi:serine/threonine protein kinase
MTNNTCPTCNGELLTSNGQTFCPACLLQQGMKSSTYGGGPRVAWKPPEIEQLTAAFPQLEIQQLLGVGGMGAVFKVRQKELDRIAALKVLPGEMAADAGFTERFLREARLLASLSHPHIVTVYEFGQRDGIYFLLMEFIDGVTLRQALRAEPIKKLGSKETLAIVGQLCDALQFAHDEGVVHRDIKPENILIDKRGRVKIADFGLARLLGQSPTMPTLTRTHQLMGTPAYMAPEQIEGLPGIDHRADIYSMGVVFYELLTGELPLGSFSPPSERAETDVRLDEVVLRTLAREPDRRYQQASQVKTDVEALRSPRLVSSSRCDQRPEKETPCWFLCVCICAWSIDDAVPVRRHVDGHGMALGGVFCCSV